MLRGVVLAICHQLFPEGVPSLRAFVAENGVAPSTFRRAADWLLELLPTILSARKPGPPCEGEEATSDREEAVKKLTDLYRWLEDKQSGTEKNACYRPEAKCWRRSESESICRSGEERKKAPRG